MINKKDMVLGVVMPVFNCLEYSKQTYESFKTSYKHEWFIIDNGSTDGTEEWVMSLGDNVTYIKSPTNVGVARAWNVGISQAFSSGCDPVLVINNDLIFDPETVDNLMSWYGINQQGRAEVVSVTNVGTTIEELQAYEKKAEAIGCPNFIGFVINHRTIKRVGWFDEGYKIAYFEDDDYKHRLQKEGVIGLTVLDAPVAHLGSRTSREGHLQNHEEQFTLNRVRFMEKWGYAPEIEGCKPFRIAKVRKPKLLWCGDAVAPTGFAKVTHSVLNWLKNFYDISVIGVNYYGDAHQYPYDIYPAKKLDWQQPWGDDRVVELIQTIKPDVVMILNDHWIVRVFLHKLAEYTDLPPVVAYIPVDGKNVPYAQQLDKLDAAIFYTQFGLDEARNSGFMGDAFVIPHGVDLQNFKKATQAQAREAYGLSSALPKDAFIFGNVNRNQDRKRQDLSIKYFKHFLEETKSNNAFLYFHCSAADLGYDINQLATYYGINERVFMPAGNFGVWSKIKEELMYIVYNCFDVHMSTTQGEGWGLSSLEAAACGIPQILPDWSALGDWAKDIALMVPCTTTSTTTSNINVIGGVADETEFVNAMVRMYNDPDLRAEYGEKGFKLAQDPKFSWANIALQFRQVLTYAMEKN